MKDSIEDRTKSGLVWNVFLKIPYELIRFALSIAVARVLDPEDFGIVSIATILIYYANTMTNYGFNHAIVQRATITKDHVDSVFTVDLAISIVFVVVSWFSAPFIAEYFKSPDSMNVIRVMSLMFVITSLYDVPCALLRRELSFKIISIAEMVREIAAALLSLVLAFQGYKHWAIVWGQLLPSIIAVIVLIKISGWKPRLAFHPKSMRELYDFGVWSFIRVQLYFLTTRLDRLIVGKYYGPALLGIYDKAKSISQMPYESISNNMSTVLFSSFSRLQSQGSDLKKMLKKSVMMYAILIVPMYVGLYSLADQFVLLFLGEKWRLMIGPMKVLCLGSIVLSFVSLFSAVAVGIGKYRQFTIMQFVSCCVMIVLLVLLTPLGLVAVAYGLMGYSLLLFCLGFKCVKTETDVSWRELIILLAPTMMSSIAMGAVVEAFKYLTAHQVGLMNFTASIFIGASVYFAIMMKYPNSELSDVRSSLMGRLSGIFKTFKI